MTLSNTNPQTDYAADGPYGDKVERLAASLWRKENPDMSVFACDAAMMESYRLRILEAQKKDG